MENKITEEATLPFNLDAEEELKYSQSKIKVVIHANNEELALENVTLVLTTQKVLIFSENPQKVVLFFKYQNAITHGIDKQSLVCMISDLTEKFPGEEEENDEEESEPDFILAKIKNTNSFELDDWIQVVGDYQLHFDYSALGQEALQKVFQIFSECSALNPDEDVPEHEQNFLDSEFITADNIDDEGRVHFNNQEDGEEDGEEYEDEDEDENEDNNDQDKIQEEEEGPK